MGLSLVFTAEKRSKSSPLLTSNVVTTSSDNNKLRHLRIMSYEGSSVYCYEDDISCTILLLSVHNYTFFLRILSDVLPPEYFTEIIICLTFPTGEKFQFFHCKQINKFWFFLTLAFIWEPFSQILNFNAPRSTNKSTICATDIDVKF